MGLGPPKIQLIDGNDGMFLFGWRCVRLMSEIDDVSLMSHEPISSVSHPNVHHDTNFCTLTSCPHQKKISPWQPHSPKQTNQETPSIKKKTPQLGNPLELDDHFSTESLAKCRYDKGGSYLKAALSAGLAWKRRLTEPSGTQIGWKQLALQDAKCRAIGLAGGLVCFLPCFFFCW